MEQGSKDANAPVPLVLKSVRTLWSEFINYPGFEFLLALIMQYSLFTHARANG